MWVVLKYKNNELNFLKKDLKDYNCIFTTKKNFNILKYSQINSFVKKKKITHIIHIAGLSRPM